MMKAVCLSVNVSHCVSFLFLSFYLRLVRPDASQLAKIPFFEDVGAMALHFLDTLFQKVRLASARKRLLPDDDSGQRLYAN